MIDSFCCKNIYINWCFERQCGFTRDCSTMLTPINPPQCENILTNTYVSCHVDTRYVKKCYTYSNINKIKSYFGFKIIAFSRSYHAVNDIVKKRFIELDFKSNERTGQFDWSKLKIKLTTKQEKVKILQYCCLHETLCRHFNAKFLFRCRQISSRDDYCNCNKILIDGDGACENITCPYKFNIIINDNDNDLYMYNDVGMFFTTLLIAVVFNYIIYLWLINLFSPNIVQKKKFVTDQAKTTLPINKFKQ